MVPVGSIWRWFIRCGSGSIQFDFKSFCSGRYTGHVEGFEVDNDFQKHEDW